MVLVSYNTLFYQGKRWCGRMGYEVKNVKLYQLSFYKFEAGSQLEKDKKCHQVLMWRTKCQLAETESVTQISSGAGRGDDLDPLDWLSTPRRRRVGLSRYHANHIRQGMIFKIRLKGIVGALSLIRDVAYCLRKWIWTLTKTRKSLLN